MASVAEQVCKVLKKGGDPLALLASASAAELDERGTRTETPLTLACRLGREEVALALLERGASPLLLDGKGCSPLEAAVEGDLGLVVGALVERGAPPLGGPEASTRSPLVSACLRGHARAALALLPHWPDVSWRSPDGGRGLLHFTVCHHQRSQARGQLVVALLARGAPAEEPDGHGSPPLALAAVCGHREAVEALLGQATRPDLSALCSALIQGWDGEVLRLLALGTDAAGQTSQGVTPLACALKRPPMVRLLLEHHPALPASPHGAAAVARCILHGDLESLRLLLEAGASPAGHSAGHSTGQPTEPPAQIALWHQRWPALRLLLAHGASPDLPDRERYLALAPEDIRLAFGQPAHQPPE